MFFDRAGYGESDPNPERSLKSETSWSSSVRKEKRLDAIMWAARKEQPRVQLGDGI